jgi:cell division protein FtsZ
MNQLKGKSLPNVEETAVVEEVEETVDTPEDALNEENSLLTDEAALAEIEPTSPETATVTPKVNERELTPTGLNGTTIVRPESLNGSFRPTHDDDGGTLVMDEEERHDDADLIRRTVDAFAKGQYSASDLDRPAFERNKTVLYAMPLLPENEFVRSKLNE